MQKNSSAFALCDWGHSFRKLSRMRHVCKRFLASAALTGNCMSCGEAMITKGGVGQQAAARHAGVVLREV